MTFPLNFRILTLLLLLVSVQPDIGAAAAPAPDGAWFITVDVDPAQVTVRDARFTPRPFKLSPDQPEPGAYLYEILDGSGETLSEGSFLAPVTIETATEEGALHHLPFPLADTTLTLRIPSFPDAAAIRFHLPQPGSAQFDFVLPRERLASAALPETSLQIFFENGPRGNRLNIVVLGDGFTADQTNEFTSQATAAIDQFLSAAPLSSYRSWFNAYGIFTPSAEAGSDHPDQNDFRDTWFNSTFQSHGIGHLLTIPPNDHDSNYQHGRGKVYTLLQQHLPEYDIVMMVVNDPEYGGSGGLPAITSNHAAAPEIVVHELAHSFADLGDEYSSAYPGYPDIEEPNTTRETRRQFIKWNHWIDEATPVPTPAISAYSGVIGLFEGAHYHASDWYRPKRECKMRSLGQDFCAVCGEAIVIALSERISTIDTVTPATDYISVSAGSEISLSANLLQPESHGLEVSWTLNGLPLDESSSDLTVAQLAPGTHELTIVVSDPTPAVRSDPQDALISTHSWEIEVIPSGPRLINVSVAGGGFHFATDRTVALGIVEVSTDLQNWLPVSTNTFAAGEPYILPASAGDNTLFLRVAE